MVVYLNIHKSVLVNIELKQSKKNQMKNTNFLLKKCEKLIDEMLKLYLGFEIESQHLFKFPCSRKEKKKYESNNNKRCKLMLFTLSHVVLGSQLGLVWSWSCFVICMGVRKAFTKDILHYRLAV